MIKQYCVRVLRLIFGLFLYAFGIVVTMKAHVGYAPWEVFHAGISNMTGISIGTVSIITGAVIVAIGILLGEKVGLGTFLNMLLIGTFMNLILMLDVIPESGNLALGVVMLIAGLFIISVGSYFYIESSFGAGPRDSLMVSLARKTKLPIGICRGTIECTAVLIGWLLGGMVGIGTVISMFAIGFCVQITFKVLRFDPVQIKHETLAHTYAVFTGRLPRDENNENKEEQPAIQDSKDR